MLLRSRTIGAIAVALGLLLAALGFAATAAPAGAAGTGSTAPICNQQKASTPDRNCQGEELHGEAAVAFDAAGNLVFDIVAVPGFRGWSGLKICIPQVGPTDAADCTGADGPLSPSVYEVTGASGVDERDKDVTFDCDGSFRATVDAAALPAGDPTFTLHLSPCAGGTDEAFGSGTRPASGGGGSSSSSSSTTSTSSTTTSTSTSTTSTTSTTTTTTPVPPAPSGTDGDVAPAVLGEVLVRPAADVPTPAPLAVAPAVTARPAATAPAELPRTGSSTGPLVTLGLGLVLAGVLVLVAGSRRPAPALAVAAAVPPMAANRRPLALTVALVAAGAVLDRGRRR